MPHKRPVLTCAAFKRNMQHSDHLRSICSYREVPCYTTIGHPRQHGSEFIVNGFQLKTQLSVSQKAEFAQLSDVIENLRPPDAYFLANIRLNGLSAATTFARTGRRL